jgi:hypothetical protein
LLLPFSSDAKVAAQMIRANMLQVECLLLDKEIDPAEYKEIKNEYEDEIGKLEREIEQVGKLDCDLKDQINFCCDLIENLPKYY